MSLEEIYYFSVTKQRNPPVFDFVQKIVIASEADQQNATEIQRRLSLLSRSSGNEHLRQCADFIAEAVAFDELLNQGKNPHWVPENGSPAPDIQYASDDKKTPVEVKHLNNPRDEHEALASGQTWGGSVNPNYDAGIEQKITDFVTAAKRKFVSYNKQINGVDDDNSGTLYLFFSKSIDANLTDGIPWETTMEDRVKAFAESIIGDGIVLIVRDLNSSISN